MTCKRNPDYWAKDMPSSAASTITTRSASNYFRDENAMFEAFKKGEVDIFSSKTNTGRWATRLRLPGGRPTATSSRRRSRRGLPSGMFGFVLNTRRAVFKDRDVRAGARPACSISNGPTRTCSPAPISAPAAIYDGFRRCPRSGRRRATPRRRCSQPYADSA